MISRVTANTFPDSLVPQLQTIAKKQIQMQEQLATGQRITNPSDDPAGMGRILKLQSEKREITQFQRNVSRLDSLAKFQFKQIQSMQTGNQRALEIASQTNEITGRDSYNAYAMEINQILEQSVELGNSRFLGDHVFGGTAVDAPPFTPVRDVDGNITSVTYGGSAQSAEVSIAEESRIAISTDGATNQQFADFLNNLVTLRDSMNAQDGNAVRAAQQNLMDDEDNLVISMSDIASNMSRLEMARTQAESRFTSLNERVSREADVDFADSIVQLTRSQNAYQAAMQSGARMMNESLLNYI